MSDMNKQNWFIVLCVTLRDRAVLIGEKIYAITLTNRMNKWFSLLCVWLERVRWLFIETGITHNQSRTSIKQGDA